MFSFLDKKDRENLSRALQLSKELLQGIDEHLTIMNQTSIILQYIGSLKKMQARIKKIERYKLKCFYKF
jgi:uncharacterized protein YdeI (YjbR/CyaY-like superfamily)